MGSAANSLARQPFYNFDLPYSSFHKTIETRRRVGLILGEKLPMYLRVAFATHGQGSQKSVPPQETVACGLKIGNRGAALR